MYSLLFKLDKTSFDRMLLLPNSCKFGTVINLNNLPIVKSNVTDNSDLNFIP